MKKQKNKLFFERPLEERKKIWKQIETDKAFRIWYFKTDFYAFALYYFGHNFITGIANFHLIIYGFCVSDLSSIIIGFRECAKTTIVCIIYVVYVIAYQFEDYIVFLALDLDSSQDKVMNVSNFLRANKKFKADYGLLYDDGTSRLKNSLQKINEQKTMSKFITTNGIKVEGVSLKNMKRGKLLLDEDGNIIRPSLLIGDDLDNEESVRNLRIITENTAKIKSGILKSIRGKAIFLGNIITDDGVIQRLEAIYKGYRNTTRIALIENGEITWEKRYVWTQKEANELNNKLYEGKKVVQSIEELSIDKESFNSDFLNLPRLIIGNPVFDIEKIDECKTLEIYFTYKIKVEDREVDLLIFDKNFKKDYYDYLHVGIDTGSGQGGECDNSDMTFLDKDGNLYAKITSNIINYSHIRQILTILYKDFGFNFFDNSLGIERNLYGIDLIDDIRRYDEIIFSKLFIPKTEGKKIEKYTNIAGWVTSESSKEKLKEDMRKSIIYNKMAFDKEEKREFKFWTYSEINGRIVYEPDKINCKHDDRIIGRGIAFQMFLNKNPNFLENVREK